MNHPADIAEYSYQRGDIDFDVYEAAQLAALDGVADFVDGEVRLDGAAFVVDFDDNRESITVR